MNCIVSGETLRGRNIVLLQSTVLREVLNLATASDSRSHEPLPHLLVTACTSCHDCSINLHVHPCFKYQAVLIQLPKPFSLGLKATSYSVGT